MPRELAGKRFGAVDAVLLAAIGVDVALVLMAMLTPQSWFDILHGGLQPDELHLGFLYRAAAHWTAFVLLQVFTLFIWRRAPVWLAVTAGARFSDTLTDLTYWSTAPTLSGNAWMLLPPPLLNAGMALLLLAAYRRLAPTA